MVNSPLLSIVVPTHNRSKYAVKCIEAVLTIDARNIELVVSDTSTDSKLHDVLRSQGNRFLEDARFVYRKIDEPSNLTKNNNDAVAMATGEYVCLIGDDDCISDVAIDAALWAQQNDIDVISQTVSSNYAWPDFQSRLAGKGHAGNLYVPRKLKQPTMRNARTDLEFALANAFQGTDQMPRCYHGIVRRSLLDKVKELTGAYFHGSSPDMSGAVSIACLIENYLEVDIPLTIPGASAGSNSGRSAMNTHKGTLSSETQTSSFQDKDWTDGVPKFFSVETVWAHAGLQSLAKLKPDLIKEFNFPRLLALADLRHPEYRSITDLAKMEVAGILSESYSRLSTNIQNQRRNEWVRRLRHYSRRALIPTASGGRKHMGDLNDIAAASNALRGYMSLKAFHFSSYMAQHRSQICGS